ncbi:MAG: hypothetical protein R3C49_00815 [Planctomycetaceae bacterium]
MTYRCLADRGFPQVTASIFMDAEIGATGPLSEENSLIFESTADDAWKRSMYSSRYILHVRNLTTGGIAIREDSLTGTSFTPAAALASGNYRVWVKAIGSTGIFTDGQWSIGLNFPIT